MTGQHRPSIRRPVQRWYTDPQGVQRELDLYTWNGKLVVIDDDMPTVEQEGFYIKAKSTDEGAMRVVADILPSTFSVTS